LLLDFLKRLIAGTSPVPDSADWPEPLREYMSKRSKPQKDKPLADLRFVVFDTETTGLDLAKNRLLSIAGVGMHGLDIQLDDTFDSMVAQADVGGSAAAVIHGLISNDLAGGLPEGLAVSHFLAFAGGAVLVAHHAGFDLRMLQKAIAPYGGAKLWSPVIDTAQLAERVEHGLMSSNRARGVDERKAYQLDSLVERYGIDVPERHTAAGDALATALLFQRLLKKAERRGIRTLGDLLAH
jgi:DNA polymerase-3 subunit epsilon